MLRALQGMIKPSQEMTSTFMDEIRRDMMEAMRLKTEMDAISQAIHQTKAEIATLHYKGTQGKEMARVTDELGAIVADTESATNGILASAERIDELAGNLASRVAPGDRDMAGEISEKVVTIFEACNFQDITGQRISKVVTTMQFVEERVNRMIEIWGGLESFKDIETLADPNREGDKALLNGPSLATDEGLTSQDAIDALFG